MSEAFEHSLQELIGRPPTRQELQEATSRLSALFQCLLECEREENESNNIGQSFQQRTGRRSFPQSSSWTTYRICEPERS